MVTQGGVDLWLFSSSARHRGGSLQQKWIVLWTHPTEQQENICMDGSIEEVLQHIQDFYPSLGDQEYKMHHFLS